MPPPGYGHLEPMVYKQLTATGQLPPPQLNMDGSAPEVRALQHAGSVKCKRPPPLLLL